MVEWLKRFAYKRTFSAHRRRKAKATFVAAFLLFLSSSVVAGGYFRGIDLLEFCDRDSKACGVFLMGVSDTHNLFVAWGDTKAIYCKPTDVTAEILVPVVSKYLREHPEELHHGGAGLAITAMSRAWPCR